MSRTMFIRERCVMCGAISKYQLLLSTNAFGSYDLDSRPPRMKRDTMRHWVHECPECGYVASRVSKSSGVDKDFLESDRYVNCDRIDFKSGLARRFYRYYLIAQEERNDKKKLSALLCAAWASDDRQDLERAKHCRSLAAQVLAEIIPTEAEPGKLYIQRADIMRRAGLFPEVVNEYKSVILPNDREARILLFEIQKAKERDTSCYTVADVFAE